MVIIIIVIKHVIIIIIIIIIFNIFIIRNQSENVKKSFKQA